MKGVSTIIIVILMLLIAISLIGFVSVFLQRSVSTAADQAGTQQQQIQTQLTKQLRIDNVAGTAVTVRNTGTATITLATEVTVYKDEVIQTCTWSVATLPLGGVATCTLPSACTGGMVKAVAPAGPTPDAAC